jgi:MFS superfamily sulfate permease-like transporter
MQNDRPTPGKLSSVQQDVFASIVVFLVALPLCMGIAIASGVPPEKAAGVGIISGIIGGSVVGLLGGCALQVTGPAAGVAVIVGQLIMEHGFATLGLIVLVAGAVQLVAGVLHLGQWFRAISPAIIQGMLAGIGVLVFGGQFHVMVDDTPPGSGKEYGGIVNVATIPEAVWKGVTEPAHQPAAVVGIVTILTLVGWSFAPKRLKVLPAPLLAVAVATVLAAILERLGLDPKDIQVPNTLTEAISLPAWGDLPRLLDRSILLAGLTLAFIASAETLLTATAVDAMQHHAPRTNYDRELAAQGVGNLLCGVLGVLPLTGVIVRSGANVQAGGRTRLATILHGLWLLLFAALLPFVLRLIPVSSLAAILVYTGCKLVDIKAIRELRGYGKGELAVYMVTLVGIVVIDLLTGIVLGLGLALAQLMYRFTHLTIRVEQHAVHNRTHMYLEGVATFIRLPKLFQALQAIPPNTELHVHIQELGHIDHACLDLLMKWEKQHEATGGSLVIDWDSLAAKFRQVSKTNGNNGRAPTQAVHEDGAKAASSPRLRAGPTGPGS